MKTSLRCSAVVGALGIALTLSSCVNPYAGPYQRNGTVIGAVGGGTLGAIIGNQSGRPLEGAAIGGLLGALAGSQIGASRDQRYYYGNYYGVRSSPVYYRGGYPYRYSYSPYRYSYSRYGYSPYRYGYSPYRYGYSPFGSGLYTTGFGFGRSSFYCW